MFQNNERPLRVLIADDVDGICGCVVLLLEQHGYIPLEANDGQTALEMIIRGDVDLAVLDIIMPRMTGIHVLKEVRMLGMDLPIIIFTGITDAGPAMEAVQFGADAVLAKPDGIHELIGTIRNVLKARRQREWWGGEVVG